MSAIKDKHTKKENNTSSVDKIIVLLLSVLLQIKKFAPGEDRTHDLRISHIDDVIIRTAPSPLGYRGFLNFRGNLTYVPSLSPLSSVRHHATVRRSNCPYIHIHKAQSVKASNATPIFITKSAVLEFVDMLCSNAAICTVSAVLCCSAPPLSETLIG